MSTLKIINGTKPSQDCTEFCFNYTGGYSSEDNASVPYVDCNGIDRVWLMTWEEADGRSYDTCFCAKSIGDISGPAVQIAPKNPEHCIPRKTYQYSITALANSGDDLIVEYIDRDGNTQTASTYAGGGTLGTQIQVGFCAQEGSYTIIQQARGIIGETNNGPC